MHPQYLTQQPANTLPRTTRRKPINSHARTLLQRLLFCALACTAPALTACESTVPIFDSDTDNSRQTSPSRTLRPTDFSSGLGTSASSRDSQTPPTQHPTQSLQPLDINAATPASGILASSDDTPSPQTSNPSDDAPPESLTIGAGVEVLTPQQASEGLTNIIARAGPPDLLNSATPIGDPVYIDGKLGDVNGKPIFASIFLDTGSATIEPVGRRLAETAKQRPLNAWRAYARDEIRKRVGLFVRDEILRAEALSTLSEDQKVGFLNWIEKLQRDAQRRSGASQAVTERTLLQTEGITLDEWKKREQDKQLIQLQLQERVGKRVQVSARDIEQRYDQRSDIYNRPPLATFRQIVVPGNQPEAIEDMTRRLAAGESFEELAKSDLNISKRSSAGLEPRELSTPRPEGNFFANPQLNNAARTMNVGDVFGPVDISAGKAWIYLEKIEDRSQDLYHAQLSIESQLQNERFNRGLDRYLARLERRVSRSDAEDIIDQLLALAEKRYYLKK